MIIVTINGKPFRDLYEKGKAIPLYAAAPVAGAPNIADGLWPLIRMLQEFAFPVGVGVAAWGAIEWMLDNPAGKERIKKAILGYILIFIIPTFFMAIRNAFNSMAL